MHEQAGGNYKLLVTIFQKIFILKFGGIYKNLNVYFKEASVVQAAEIETDFLVFSCLAVVLVKEFPSTVLRV